MKNEVFLFSEMSNFHALQKHHNAEWNFQNELKFNGRNFLRIINYNIKS